MTHAYLRIRGVRAPVHLTGDPWSAAQFSGYLPLDDISFATQCKDRPFASLHQSDGHTVFQSAFDKEPKLHVSQLNAICDLIAAIPRQRAVEQPNDLCLHAAAVQFGQNLAIFPAQRRAGKSVLTASLAARGHTVFGDDVLVVRAEPGSRMKGEAMGAAIRLRVPLPLHLPKWVAQHVQDHPGPENAQYRYLPSPMIAPHGRTAQFASLVSLERTDSGRAAIEPMSRGVMLKSLLHHNFAREADANHILAGLRMLAQNLPAYKLTYSRLEDAIDVLETEMAGLSAPELIFPDIPEGGQFTPTQAINGDDTMIRNPKVEVFSLDQESFAASDDQSCILHLDDGAMRLWALLSEPTSLNDAIAILIAAFPDADPKKIAADTAAILLRFSQKGLIALARDQ